MRCFFDNRESERAIGDIKVKLMKCVKGIDPARGRRIRRYNILYRQEHQSGVPKGGYEERTFEIPLKVRKIVGNKIVKPDEVEEVKSL